MNMTTLTQRQYVGDGYSDTIKNIETGELITTLCTLENYEDTNYPDIPEGFEYVSSQGGFPLLDSGLGQEGDGFIRDGEYYVYESDPTLGGLLTLNKYSEGEFNSKYIWQ